MKQLTPQSWGRVYWGGGAGKPGEMGGWRFHCNWCTEGDRLTAFGRKMLADVALSNHCIEKHSYKTEVRALLQATPNGFVRHWESSTGVAESDGLIVNRSVCSCGKQRPCFEHGLDFKEDYDGNPA